MLNETLLFIAMMATTVLLPLIPAFLLFKFLPTTGEVSGPLQGLTVKFGGAFAAYLIIFLPLYMRLPEPSTHYHTWTIVGKLDTTQLPSDAPANLNDVFIRAVPPRLSVLNDGTFSWEVAVAEDDRGAMVFPYIQLDLPGYRGVTLALGRDRAYGAPDAEIVYDAKARQIRVKNPIVLKSTKLTPAYEAIR